jgi:hypothetical protein
MRSFLPDRESDRRHLSRQGEASHRRLHPFPEQALVEIAERSLPAAVMVAALLKMTFMS